MRNYWSLSKVGDAIRKWFGLPKMLSSGTSEEWAEYETKSKEISPIGYAIVEALDKVQAALFYIPDRVRDGIYYLSNWGDSTHVLRTNVKIGGYADTVNKIPDALLYSIVDFVEKECFWMVIMCDLNDVRTNNKVLQDYYDQSYIKRKIFPIKISDAYRAEIGLLWLEYQNDAKFTEDERHNSPYKKLIAAYHFTKTRYNSFDPYEESGYNKLPVERNFIITDEMRVCFDKIHELEKEFSEQVTKHCQNIVEYRDYLWT